MFKVSKYSLLAVALVGNVSCASTEPELPEHFSRWSFGFVQPYLYPAYLTHNMYAVNEKEDWTQPVLFSARNQSWEYVQEAYGNYDGYGVAFANDSISSQLGLGTNHLPDTLYIEWLGYDSTRYQTIIDVTPKMKAKMLEPHPHPLQWKDWSCYQTKFLFGLLPNGNAKLWLSGCRIYTYVGEFKPKDSIKHNDPEDKKLIKIREDEVGVKAEPIPWDNVDKVYYNQRYFKMDRLDDWEPKK